MKIKDLRNELPKDDVNIILFGASHAPEIEELAEDLGVQVDELNELITKDKEKGKLLGLGCQMFGKIQIIPSL